MVNVNGSTALAESGRTDKEALMSCREKSTIAALANSICEVLSRSYGENSTMSQQAKLMGVEIHQWVAAAVAQLID